MQLIVSSFYVTEENTKEFSIYPFYFLTIYYNVLLMNFAMKIFDIEWNLNDKGKYQTWKDIELHHLWFNQAKGSHLFMSEIVYGNTKSKSENRDNKASKFLKYFCYDVSLFFVMTAFWSCQQKIYNSRH